MSLLGFGSDDDDGCTAHHFEHYDLAWRMAAVRDTDGRGWGYCPADRYIVLAVPLVATCEHEGCTETDRKPREEKKYIPLGALCETSAQFQAYEQFGNVLDTDVEHLRAAIEQYIDHNEDVEALDDLAAALSTIADES